MTEHAMQFLFNFAIGVIVVIAIVIITAVVIYLRRPTDQQKIVDTLNHHEGGDWYFDSTTNTYRDNLSVRFHRANEFCGGAV